MLIRYMLLWVMLGCGSSRGPAPAVTWRDTCQSAVRSSPVACGTIAFARSQEATFAIDHADGHLTVSFDNVEVGTAGRLKVASSQSDPQSKLPIVAKLGALTVAQVKGKKVDLGLSITFEFPRHEATTVVVPPVDLAEAITQLMSGVTESPVVLPGESASSRPDRHTLLWVNKEWDRIHGPGKTLLDIDLIAVDTRGPERALGYCTYAKMEGGGGFDLEPKGQDVTVTIYERKTGREVTKRTFPAKAMCPKGARSTDRIEGTVDEEAVKAWIKERAT